MVHGTNNSIKPVPQWARSIVNAKRLCHTSMPSKRVMMFSRPDSSTIVDQQSKSDLLFLLIWQFALQT